ncbi:MAG: ABC transporter permease [Rhodococcus sp. (in: high G+C Gram-positive bacteria)]
MMGATSVAVCAGARRAAIEVRQLFTDAQGVANLFLFPILIMIALWFMRNGTFQSTEFVLASLALPGVMGTIIFFNGLYGIGAILGAVVGTARSLFFVTMPLMAVVAISGIFYPITALPGWLQGVAQVLPCYWLGLGLRSALLPASAVDIEIGQSWRHLETAGVLGAWAVAGLVLAPIVLRHMARNESGSKMDERRDKALARAY